MNKIKYLNGDSSLFFRNKINKLKDNTDIINYLDKRIGKKFIISAESVSAGIIQRELWIESYSVELDTIKIITKANNTIHEQTVNVIFKDIKYIPPLNTYQGVLAKDIITIKIMDKIIYILKNIHKVEDWVVYKTLQEAEDAMHTNIMMQSQENREARAKELIIITKII
jgi:hypothetical protein